MRMRRYRWIRKCMNTKAQQDEVGMVQVENDQIELKVWNEAKATKARGTRTVRSERDWQSTLEMILCSFLALIPRECHYLLPHPPSYLTISTQILSPSLHVIHSLTHRNICRHTSTKTCMYMTLSHCLPFSSISKYFLQYARATHKHTVAAVLN